MIRQSVISIFHGIPYLSLQSLFLDKMPASGTNPSSALVVPLFASYQDFCREASASFSALTESLNPSKTFRTSVGLELPKEARRMALDNFKKSQKIVSFDSGVVWGSSPRCIHNRWNGTNPNPPSEGASLPSYPPNNLKAHAQLPSNQPVSFYFNKMNSCSPSLIASKKLANASNIKS